ncbi:MAG: class I SAM-dependent methyltransferase [Acidimicrobiales bacterium]|nr:class I SAM-dependent methyltransferase [Acidimicrobiales bacterium]
MALQEEVQDEPLTTEEKAAEEAKFFGKQDNQRARAVGWSSLGYFQRRLHKRINLVSATAEVLGDRTPKRGLTLGCGDMTGEYRLFNLCQIDHITAYDISEGQRDKFYDYVYNPELGIEVDYRIGDAANDDLGENEFDMVYIQQSYHHFEEVEKVAANIARALKPDGVFVLNDYIGPPFLQRTEKQREVTRRIWKTLPKRFRKGPNGKIHDDILIPPIESLPPHEAIRSDAILPALREHFDVIDEHQFAGLLFPLFNGFAQNYDEKGVQPFIRSMWEMDELLIEQGVIEPNFIRGLYRTKG